MQQPFSMDDLKQVRLAAWQAGNPFFEQGLVDKSYSRTLFCGRGVLLIAHRMAHRPVQQALGLFVSPPRLRPDGKGAARFGQLSCPAG
ncbi:hypothetical protein [Streptomyces sp. NBC_00724]|uniref:hypothetical protein n=1 Tax=Streptomyces sp. NBC_00724 TaxID=2975812 RepID=UPI002ED583E5|nr:hypothetical protein OHB17_42765 [Streptomyces sp. NBC_00724]